LLISRKGVKINKNGRSEKMFKIKSKYKPSGDQPQAIKQLITGIKENKKHQVLLGATGTGKTFTIANVIEKIQKPTLVLAHNKTLAGQLYSELKELFPNNRVEYFVSYYDYYQPEAYVAKTDTYIEKDASINDEIDELRHSATSALLNHKDVIVVASVSCIYGIGEIEEYKNKTLTLNVGDQIDRDVIIEKLIDMLYERNNIDLKRGSFRVRGDILEIVPISQHGQALRIDFFGDEIEKINEFNTLTGEIISNKKSISIFPASHFVTSEEKLKIAINNIREELEEQLQKFKSQGKLLEYQRLSERTNYDLEMLAETGFCRGVENYSRHIALKKAGETPTTLIDFFGEDYLLVIDESHVTIPQIGGMYNGDQAR
jgi:excinuclease ABC subunit B